MMFTPARFGRIDRGSTARLNLSLQSAADWASPGRAAAWF